MAVGLAKPLHNLAKTNDVVLDVTARVGAPTIWGLDRAEEVGSIYDLWLVCLGTNDVRGNQEAAIQHAMDIKQLAIDKGAQTIFLIPPDGGALDGHKDFFDTQQSAVSSFISPPEKVKFASDGVHLTPQGYSDWAEYVWESLR